MRSHLLSQVVLKRFANENKKTTVHDIKSDRSELKEINLVAYLDIDGTLIAKLEAKWSKEVENDAEKAINALTSGNLQNVDKHIGTVKKLMALHYMRSTVFIMMHDQAWSGQFYPKDNIEQIIALYPQHEDLVRRTTSTEWQTTKTKAAIQAMEIYIPKVEAYIADIGLEVGVAQQETQFILGDIPVVTADGTGRFGALNGVPITESKGFAMPLSPKHIVSLKKNATSKKYVLLNARQVQNANDKQLKQAVNCYYTKPA